MALAMAQTGIDLLSGAAYRSPTSVERREATMASVAPQVQAPFSPEEYLALERSAEVKSEYVDGVIVAMAGASRNHNVITLHIGGELDRQLRGRPCEAYVSDMRVKVGPTHYTYPDVVVACDDIRFEDDELDTLVNPVAIIEVLSPSTADYDRGGKFTRYRSLSWLQEFVVVAQHRVWVERFSRQGDTWVLRDFYDVDDTVTLDAIGCVLRLADIYAGVDVSEPELSDGTRKA